MGISFKKFLPGIAWFFIIVYLTCTPASKLPQIGWLASIPQFDKMVHVGLFAVLTFLFCWPLSKSSIDRNQRLQYFIKIAVAASIWGLTIEFIQKFWIPSRSFDLWDWAADSAGALIAFFYCRWKFFSK